MQNVKFFDKNGVELKVGDIVTDNNGNKDIVAHFRLADNHNQVVVSLKSLFGYIPLHSLTKYTPKITKVKRTFEEVCELRDSGAMFRTPNADHYKPSIMIAGADIYIIGEKLCNLKFKTKNSDTWQDLEYKEVEE